MIEARIICDSISDLNRLTTFQLRYPKFIHSEYMTHRRFSRNASSSRAVPIAKSLEEVRNPALRAAPVHWGRHQPGMQADEELDSHAKSRVMAEWHDSAMRAADAAETMLREGAHKQVVNRILEPYLHINVVCSATEYMNFFGLRLDKGAQPEMRALAATMWSVYSVSKPKRLAPGEWHLPYVHEQRDHQRIKEYLRLESAPVHSSYAIKMSVARCARVSYLSFETGGAPTIEEDLKLYERLLGSRPVHASPAEHQATPDTINILDWRHPGEHGNFNGWRQYRKQIPGESVALLPEEYR